tara:strand:+ start:1228 stop:2142 length:915 start_codon:yes stop_codon:yes gene_type:complete
MMISQRRRASIWFAFATALMAPFCISTAAEESPTSLQLVQQSGTLQVALYDAFPPYSSKRAGRPAGIDVDIAQALATELGLNLKLRLFAADENMGDDLRNNLWKGHYLGGGVADVMMHVPADPEFAAKEDKVVFFGPYFREAVAVAHDTQKIESVETPLVLSGHKVGVEVDSISDYYLSGAFNGRLRTAAVRFPTARDAVKAFAAGEVDAVMAPRGELQGLIKEVGLQDLAYDEQELVGMFRTAWDLGMAVKRHADDSLLDAVESAMVKLRERGTLADIFKRHGVAYVAPSVDRLARVAPQDDD